MYSVDFLDSFDVWQKNRESFDRLAGQYATRSFAWQSAWWKAYQNENTSLRVLRLSSDTEVVAYLPLYLDRTTSNAKLCLIGSGKACSDDLGIYVRDGHEAAAAELLVRHLYETGVNGEWVSLELEGVRNNTLAMNRLLTSMRAEFGGSFYEYEDQVCRLSMLTKDFDSYLTQNVSRNSRTMFRRWLRQYLDTGRLTFEYATSYEQAKTHIAQVAELHKARWNSKGESGCVATPNFDSFLSNLGEQLWDSGSWFSMVMSIDGNIASGAIGAKTRDFLNIYVTGMSPEQSEHRPGTLMNLINIKHAIEQGCKYYDLMRGDEPYKSRLGAEPVSQYLWKASAPRALPRLRGKVENATKSLRQWMRSYRETGISEAVEG